MKQAVNPRVGEFLHEAVIRIAGERGQLTQQLADQRTKVSDYRDTVHACLIAAGGSENINELERQVCAAGTTPSDFVRQQLAAAERKITAVQETLDRWHDQATVAEITSNAVSGNAIRAAQMRTCQEEIEAALTPASDSGEGKPTISQGQAGH
jgi:hypothetical protein